MTMVFISYTCFRIEEMEVLIEMNHRLRVVIVVLAVDTIVDITILQVAVHGQLTLSLMDGTPVGLGINSCGSLRGIVVVILVVKVSYTVI